MQCWREEVEAYLLAHTASVPDCMGVWGVAFRLRQACGAMPLPARADLVRLALPEHSARAFSPFLSAGSAERLQQAARLWLQLCVLEDKLQRLAGWADETGDRAALIQVRCALRCAVAGPASIAACRLGCMPRETICMPHCSCSLPPAPGPHCTC